MPACIFPSVLFVVVVVVFLGGGSTSLGEKLSRETDFELHNVQEKEDEARTDEGRTDVFCPVFLQSKPHTQTENEPQFLDLS